METQKANELRDEITKVRTAINKLKESVDQDKANLVIPELVIANRHLEGARMRLGVALAYNAGANPWESTVEEK